MLISIVVGPDEVFPDVVEYVAGLCEHADITRRWKREPWYVWGSESWNMVRYPEGWPVADPVPSVVAGPILAVGSPETKPVVGEGVDHGFDVSRQLFRTTAEPGGYVGRNDHLSETYRVLGDDVRLAKRRLGDVEETARRLRGWVREVERIRARFLLNSAARGSRVRSAKVSRFVRLYDKQIRELRTAMSRKFKCVSEAAAHLENVMIARSVVLKKMEGQDVVDGGLPVKAEITIKHE